MVVSGAPKMLGFGEEEGELTGSNAGEKEDSLLLSWPGVRREIIAPLGIIGEVESSGEPHPIKATWA